MARDSTALAPGTAAGHGRFVIWFGLTAAAFLAAEFAGGAARGTWIGWSGMLRLSALLFALIGAAEQLRHARTRDIDRRAHIQSLEDAVCAAERHRRDQAHEARSALAAIEHAIRFLADLDDNDPRTKDALRAAVATELTVLRRLLDHPADPVEIGPFAVAEAVAAAAAVGRALGTDLAVSIPDGLTAFGSSGVTTQIIHNLLDNARRHAPDSPIRITGHRDHGWIEIRVEDSGPGIPEELHGSVLLRGFRASDGRGSGLGLSICAELMARQGGRIWVEASPTGGAAFVLGLPSHRPAGAWPRDDIDAGAVQ